MRLSPGATLAHMLLASKIPGKQRMVLLLARHLQSLQLIPIEQAYGATLYLDLRIGDAHGLLTHPHAPDEQTVMSYLVNEGDIALDVGAHLGVYTILLAYLVGPDGHVFSFEPNPTVVMPLAHTVKNLPNASLHPFALSDKSARTDFFVPAHDSMASLKNWTGNTDGRPHKISCQTQRLDNLIETGRVRQPDFIKCDVEGAELQVFRGAHRCLNRVDAPILLFEVNVNTARGFGITTSSTVQYLRKLELPAYHFFKIEGDGTLVPVYDLGSPHSNIVAIPDSKLSTMTLGSPRAAKPNAVQ